MEYKITASIDGNPAIDRIVLANTDVDAMDVFLAMYPDCTVEIFTVYPL